MKKSPLVSRWFRLLLGVVALLFAGVIYSWSILKAPLAAEFGWTADKLAVNYTLSLIFFCIGGLLSGLSSQKVSSRIRLLCAAILAFLGFFMTSRLSGSSLLPLYLSYGAMAGMGIGIAYNTVISDTNAWFPDRSGLSSGSLMMGFGFSTLLLGNLCSRLMEFPSFGWRKTYLLLAVALGLVLLVAACFLRRPGPQVQLPAARSRQRRSADFRGLELNSPQMIRRPSFWKLFIFLSLVTAVGITAISFAKDFAQSLGFSPALSVTLVGVLAVCNGLGRLVSGGIFDSCGVHVAKYCASFFALLAPALALTGLLTGSSLLGAIGLCLCGFAYGFSPTLSAAIVRSFYGERNFALNFSVNNLGLLFAAVFPTLAGKLITASGAYVSSFLLLLLASAVGLIFNLSVRRP